MFGKYLSYIKEIEWICKKKHFLLDIIGYTEGADRFPLYLITVNPHAKNKKTILLEAGIHGDEVSGPLSVLNFIKTYKSNITHPKIIIMPIANPYGYNLNQHRNAQNLNLNRHCMQTRRCKECATLIRAANSEDIFFAASFHEDDVKHGSYMYAYSKEKSSPSVFLKLINRAGKLGAICRDTHIYRQLAKDGIVLKPKNDGSFEQRMCKDGVPYVICLEVPDKFSMQKRIKINIAIINEIIHFCAEN